MKYMQTQASILRVLRCPRVAWCKVRMTCLAVEGPYTMMRPSMVVNLENVTAEGEHYYNSPRTPGLRVIRCIASGSCESPLSCPWAFPGRCKMVYCYSSSSACQRCSGVLPFFIAYSHHRQQWAVRTSNSCPMKKCWNVQAPISQPNTA